MIQTRSQDRVSHNALGGQTIDMSIDAAATAHLMTVLTDLYSDPELAVVREYSTNAADSHVAANVKRPIEVTTPTEMHPFLTIRDFGVGLSAQDIEDIYSKYGASSKRNTNDQQGMLGLGCKSALTYSDQFTLVSVKDGERIQVSVSRNASGVGTMTIPTITPTDEDNGVEIIIPCKRFNKIAEKAAYLFSFWPEGTVLLDGKAPKRIEGLALGDDMIVYKSEGYYDKVENTIVMGNVPYPIPHEHFPHDLLDVDYKLIAWVPIGAVNFTPSREALFMDSVTTGTIDKIASDFRKAAVKAVQAAVDKAPTKHEAMRTAVSWQGAFARASKGQKYTYNGEDMPTDFTTGRPANAGMDDKTIPFTVVPVHGGKMSSHMRRHSVTAELSATALWITGYDRPTFTAGQKKKLMLWLNEHYKGDPKAIASFVLTDKAKVGDWREHGCSWGTVQALKLPRTGGYSTGIARYDADRIPGSYNVYRNGEYVEGLEAAKFDTTKPILYFNGNRHAGSAYASLLTPLLKKYTLACLEANRIDKFVRDFEAKGHKPEQVSDAIAREFIAWKKGLSTAAKERFGMEDSLGTWAIDRLARLDAGKIDDPDFKKAIKTAKTRLTDEANLRMLFQRIGRARLETRGYKSPLKTYPLFSFDNLTHSYIYVNAVYAAQKKGA